MRQDDGGWAIPARTLGLPLKAMLVHAARPSSPTAAARRPTWSPGSSCAPWPHTPATGTLAGHPPGRQSCSSPASSAATPTPDRAAPSYWLVFSYPYWWTDLLSALDSLAQIGFRASDPDIARGVAWFIDNQEANGLWNTGHNRPKHPDCDQWVGLAICGC